MIEGEISIEEQIAAAVHAEQERPPGYAKDCLHAILITLRKVQTGELAKRQPGQLFMQVKEGRVIAVKTMTSFTDAELKELQAELRLAWGLGEGSVFARAFDAIAQLRRERVPRNAAAWLIEAGSAAWWNGRTVGIESFTSNPNDACRFARYEDAERVRCWLLKQIAPLLRSTEHIYLDAAQTAQTEQRERSETGWKE